MNVTARHFFLDEQDELIKLLKNITNDLICMTTYMQHIPVTT